MSVNVKLNNVVYNGIERLRLPLASGEGFASFMLEGDEPVPGRNPLYVLGDQWDKNDTHRATVTFNGNHVKIRFNQAVSNDTLFFNLRTYAYEETDVNAIIDKPKWFTIPAGTGTLKLMNLEVPSNLIIGMNFKKANSNESTDFVVGTDPSVSLEHTSTVETAVDVGCIFLAIGTNGSWSVSAGAEIEFDVEFTVNGVLYL